ncbi:hypothetical protein [Endothiovibrio diazotrophicus]
MIRRTLLLIPFCLAAFGPLALHAAEPLDLLYDAPTGTATPDATTTSTSTSTSSPTDTANPTAPVAITLDDVYAQARRVELEVQQLTEFEDVPTMEVAEPVRADLLPRHVWQKGYAILIELQVFRRRHDLPVGTVRSVEPLRSLDPALLFEQTQYILTDLAILKARLGVTRAAPPPPPAVNKRPIDVYNLYSQVALDLQALNRDEIGASYVFAEVMRIFEDVNALLYRLGLEDTTFPPEKRVDVTPAQSLAATFELLAEVQRLQRDAGIPRTDFSAFRNRDEARSTDVFNLVGMVLAELQPLKAHLELRREITPPAEYYEGKTPADVDQLLIWITRKLRLIRSL